MTHPDDIPMLLRDATEVIGCSEASLINWSSKGYKQRTVGKLIYLETTVWLGRRYVTMAAVARFRDAIQAPVASQPVETPAERKRTMAGVKKALKERHGVGA